MKTENSNGISNFFPPELGKTYKTREGRKAIITNIDYSYSKPFLGEILTLEDGIVRVAAFNAVGRYLINGELSQFDIVGIYDGE